MNCSRCHAKRRGDEKDPRLCGLCIDEIRGMVSERATAENLGRWSSPRVVPQLSATEAVRELHGHAGSACVNLTPERVEAYLRALGHWDPERWHR